MLTNKNWNLPRIPSSPGVALVEVASPPAMLDDDAADDDAMIYDFAGCWNPSAEKISNNAIAM